MSDSVVRSISAPEVVQETPHIDVPKNKIQVQSGSNDIEPVENRPNIVLESLGIDENINSLPSEDRTNLSVVKEYVTGILKSKGLSETAGAFKTTLNNLKGEMGLDPMSEPSQVLDRIAGVVKAWQNLSFMKDGDEKRKIFLSLANMKSSSDMNKKVLETMDSYKIWR